MVWVVAPGNVLDSDPTTKGADVARRHLRVAEDFLLFGRKARQLDLAGGIRRSRIRANLVIAASLDRMLRAKDLGDGCPQGFRAVDHEQLFSLWGSRRVQPTAAVSCVVNGHCFQLLCLNGRRNPQAAQVWVELFLRLENCSVVCLKFETAHNGDQVNATTTSACS